MPRCGGRIPEFHVAPARQAELQHLPPVGHEGAPGRPHRVERYESGGEVVAHHLVGAAAEEEVARQDRRVVGGGGQEHAGGSSAVIRPPAEREDGAQVDDREAGEHRRHGEEHGQPRAGGDPAEPARVDAGFGRVQGSGSQQQQRRHHEVERELVHDVGALEDLIETGLRSTARCCGRRRHRQANSVRVCSPASRRVASLRPRSAGLPALTPAPRTLGQTDSCRRCPPIHPLHVVVDVLSRMTLYDQRRVMTSDRRRGGGGRGPARRLLVIIRGSPGRPATRSLP